LQVSFFMNQLPDSGSCHRIEAWLLEKHVPRWKAKRAYRRLFNSYSNIRGCPIFLTEKVLFSLDEDGYEIADEGNSGHQARPILDFLGSAKNLDALKKYL
jgi:hypothetical protein